MIKRITDRAIEDDMRLEGLQAVLAQCLKKVQRREAKLRDRNNGGAPKRETEWR